MLRKIILGMLLAASYACAFATTTADRWDFSWRGFESELGGFSYSLTVSGRFGGVDLNHNNQIELNELTELTIDGRDFLSCGVVDPDHRCSLSSFSYVLGGKLTFTAQRRDFWDYDEWSESTAATYVADSYVAREFFNQNLGLMWKDYFTPYTWFTIDPVPEPQTYAMLAAGLLLLLGAGKRKRASELCVD